jgi:predicted AAA+ superfamily ATPase
VSKARTIDDFPVPREPVNSTSFAQGLRLIEIERDDLSDLPKIQKLIQNRPEKYIVYCDDLAFNAEDENYRSLKLQVYFHA